MSLINRFGKSRTVQHIILVWISAYATNNSENYTILLTKSAQKESERERDRASETNVMLTAFILFCGDQ